MRRLQAVIGLLFWVAVAASAGRVVVNALAGPDGGSLRGLFQFYVGARSRAELRFPQPVDLAIGDPVFVRDTAVGLRQVGEVCGVAANGDARAALRGRADRTQILLYASAPNCGPDSHISYFTNPSSIAWVTSTLLTSDKTALITEALQGAYRQNQQDIADAVRPLVDAALHDAWAVIEQDLPAAVLRHQSDIENLGSKYEREIVQNELLPLAKRELWPIVERRAEPLADRIGLELWERVSLWRFAWRAAYDRSPLPERNLLEQEWRRFVREEGMPVVSRHSDEMVSTVRSVIQDVSRNDAVQTALQRNLSRVASDPEFQQVVWEILYEAVLSNPRIHRVIERHWTGPEAQLAFQLASDRMEPAIRRVADLL